MYNHLFQSILLWIGIFPDFIKLIGYFAFAVNLVSSNQCVGFSPRVKIYLYVLSI